MKFGQPLASQLGAPHWSCRPVAMLICCSPQSSGFSDIDLSKLGGNTDGHHRKMAAAVNSCAPVVAPAAVVPAAAAAVVPVPIPIAIPVPPAQVGGREGGARARVEAAAARLECVV